MDSLCKIIETVRTETAPRAANKKEPAALGRLFLSFGRRRPYQTLFPQTLFPKKASNDRIKLRLEITMYFIFFPPAMGLRLLLGSTRSLCLPISCYGKPCTKMERRTIFFLILSFITSYYLMIPRSALG